MQNKENVRILGIDPGYERLGVAVIEKKGSLHTLLFSKCIQTSKKLPHFKRLLLIGDEIDQIIETHAPQEVAIETLFFTNNQKTAIYVAEARGVMLLCSARHSLSVTEYGPGQIKSAVTGHGRSDKKQVMDMVPKLIHISRKIEFDDEYDAIAVALTHSASRNFLSTNLSTPIL